MLMGLDEGSKMWFAVLLVILARPSNQPRFFTLMISYPKPTKKHLNKSKMYAIIISWEIYQILLISKPFS